jgi:hypothetical protein
MSAETPRPSYRQGQALKDALAALNRAPSRPTVTISRDGNGNYSYDVRVPADDPQLALAQAMEIEAQLFIQYPPDDEGSLYTSKISATRNAKGETQLDVEVKSETAGPQHVADAVAQTYDALREQYPLNGTRSE